MRNAQALHESIEDLLLEVMGYRISPFEATELTEKIIALVHDRLGLALEG